MDTERVMIEIDDDVQVAIATAIASVVPPEDSPQGDEPTTVEEPLTAEDTEKQARD